MNPEAESKFDDMVEELEPLLVRAHYNTALDRLAEAFEVAMADSPAAGRAFISRIHLIAGSRRMHARAVSVEKRKFKA